MFKIIMPGAYGRGYRIGRAPSKFTAIENGVRHIVPPVNPYPLRRFLSWLACEAGIYDGTMERLNPLR